MALSQLALEDVEALCSGSSFLMADPIGPLLDQDDEEALSPFSLEVKAPASRSLSFSSYASSSSSPYQAMPFSPLSSPSPPPSPPFTHSASLLGTKAEEDLLSLSLLAPSTLLNTSAGADSVNDDSFEDMEWMSEKLDLSEFDLESLIGSCASEEPPSSSEDLLASLDSHLDLDSLNTAIPMEHSDPECALALPKVPPLPSKTPPFVEAKMPEVETDLKSEPSSPSSPAYTLELGSEVDVLDVEKVATSVTATIIPDPSGVGAASPIVLSIPTTGHLVVVLANKEESPLMSLSDITINQPSLSDCESDSGIESVASSPTSQSSPPSSPTPGSSRTKPYSRPEPKSSKVKSVSGAPKVVEKKLKKMEQNKTAATRYRQKKRVEQELLNSELEEVEKRNHELKEKAESINREIQYLKDLMEEVRKHRRGKTLSVA